jgi:cadmium resistance protein CadD (predicted permease)
MGPQKENHGMSFGMYILGFVIVTIGLAYGAYLAHVPQHWIGVGVIVLVGMGILKAVTHTRQKDPN